MHQTQPEPLDALVRQVAGLDPAQRLPLQELPDQLDDRQDGPAEITAHCLRVGIGLARVLSALGAGEQASHLAEEAFTGRRRVLGEDHPRTLSSAHSLAHIARCAGDYERARRLDEDTLARRRRVLGDDHPDTLSSAHNLTIDLSALGEHDAAGPLAEETHTRRGRVLGHHNPDTSSSTHNVTVS